MNYRYKSFLVLLAGAISLPAYSQIVSDQFYGGLDSGSMELDGTIANCSNQITGTGATSNCEDSSTFIRGQFGYQITDDYSVEGYYLTNQAVAIKGTGVRYSTGATPTANVNGDIKFNSLGVNVKGRYELFDAMFLTGKVGLHYWKHNSSVSATNATGTQDDEDLATFNNSLKSAFDKNGTDVFAGIGLEYTLLNSVQMQAGFDLYPYADDYAKASYLGFAVHF